MGYLRENIEDAIGKRWTKRIIIFGSVIFVYLIISFATSIWPFSVVKGVVRNVTQPERIIQSYEWFHSQYNAIEAQKRNIAVMRQTAVSERAQQELLGNILVTNTMISEYNARSNMITRNLWKDDENLPYQIQFVE